MPTDPSPLEGMRGHIDSIGELSQLAKCYCGLLTQLPSHVDVFAEWEGKVARLAMSIIKTADNLRSSKDDLNLPTTVEREIDWLASTVKAQVKHWRWSFILKPDGEARIQAKLDLHDRRYEIPMLRAALTWRSKPNLEPNPSADHLADRAKERKLKPLRLSAVDAKKRTWELHRLWRESPALGKAQPAGVKLALRDRLAQTSVSLNNYAEKEFSELPSVSPTLGRTRTTTDEDEKMLLDRATDEISRSARELRETEVTSPSSPSTPTRAFQVWEEDGAWLATDVTGKAMKFEGEGAEQKARLFVATRKSFHEWYSNRHPAGEPPSSPLASWPPQTTLPPPLPSSWGLERVCPVCRGPCGSEEQVCSDCRLRKETMQIVYFLMKEKEPVFSSLRTGKLSISPPRQRDLFTLSEDVKESACRLFDHQDFTIETWDRLEGWLLAECVRRNLPPDGAWKALFSLKQTEVANFLKEAIKASRPKSSSKAKNHREGRPRDEEDQTAYITFGEVATLTALKPYEITRLCDSGAVRFVGNGKGRLVHAGDLSRHLASRK